MDWTDLQNALFDSARDALDTLLEQGIPAPYAVAFHASYREEERVIDLPSLAVSSAATLEDDHGPDQPQDISGVRWNPADWRWDWELDDYANPALQAWDLRLQNEANRAGPQHWQAIETQFVDTVVQAARALREHFKDDPRVDPHFVALFHDFNDEVGLARASLTAELFAWHFPEEVAKDRLREEIAALPHAEQVSFYLDRLQRVHSISSEEAQAWLIAQGARASSALVERLHTVKDAYAIARILGLAGHADGAVIEALRQRLGNAEEQPTRHWCARALACLGDVEWLLGQADDVAVEGLCAPLSALSDRRAQPAPLDYSALITLLEQRPGITADVEEALKPGRSFITLNDQDLPQALLGLTSPHRVIRRHAACVLDNRWLSESAQAEAIQGLLRALQDEDVRVRELAQLSLEGLRHR
jgi:hypothetical protein